MNTTLLRLPSISPFTQTQGQSRQGQSRKGGKEGISLESLVWKSEPRTVAPPAWISRDECSAPWRGEAGRWCGTTVAWSSVQDPELSSGLMGTVTPLFHKLALHHAFKFQFSSVFYSYSVPVKCRTNWFTPWRCAREQWAPAVGFGKRLQLKSIWRRPS